MVGMGVWKRRPAFRVTENAEKREKATRRVKRQNTLPSAVRDEAVLIDLFKGTLACSSRKSGCGS